MKRLAKASIVILLVHLFFILFTNHALFFSRFDQAYREDKYEHSQWKLPLSARTLGDDGLYLYEGWRLVHGADPTLVNAEVPPLGKYVIGASVLLFGNDHVYGFFVYGAILFMFFQLACLLLGTGPTALVLTALFALDPLLTSQATITMLDGLQLFFLLLFFIVVTKIIRERDSHNLHTHALRMGITIGLFAETKFGIFAPMLVVIALLVLRQKSKKFLPVGTLLVATFFAYIFPYVQYFSLSHSLVDWLRVQKWIVSFYLHANLTPTFGSAAVALLVGRYQNIFSHLWETINQWSLVWPVVTIGGLWSVVGVFFQSKKNDTHRAWILMGAFVVLTLLFYMVIPFWTRYLLLILPLLYLLTASLVQRVRSGPVRISILLALFVFNSAAVGNILLPTPEATVRQVAYEWEHGFFQDMYENTTDQTRRAISRSDFHRFGLAAYSDAQVESALVTIDPVAWSRVQAQQSVPLTITYFTRNLGAFTQKTVLPLVKEDGRWRIPWQWNYLVDGLDLTRRLQTTIVPARRGSIIGSDKKPISYDFPSVMISVVPNQIDPNKEDSMLATIEDLFQKNITAVGFHHRYVGNSLPDHPTALAIVGFGLTEAQKQHLLSFPGLGLTPATGRVQGTSGIIKIGTVGNTVFGECCTLLYSTTTYDGIEGVEKDRNSDLKGYHGGKLELIDNGGSVVRTVFEVKKKDGTDVQL